MDAPKRPCRTHQSLPSFPLIFSFYPESYDHAHIENGKAFLCNGGKQVRWPLYPKPVPGQHAAMPVGPTPRMA